METKRAGLQNLNRHAEAEFARCRQISGALRAPTGKTLKEQEIRIGSMRTERKRSAEWRDEVTMMRSFFKIVGICSAAALAACLVIPPSCHARGTNPNSMTAKGGASASGQKDKSQTPKIDPKESQAYKTFYDTDPQNVDQRIQLGEAFVKQYPSGPYTESVYAALVQAYYLKQDWKNFYATADKALALNPNNVDVLVQVGWVIPHIYNPDEPNASQQLDKAENYEKKAIQDIATLPKPTDLTDEQFATAKADKLSEAHSGLGLVYFRRQDFQDAAKELGQATTGTSHPDPTDYYALGAALQNTKQYSQAADAFNHCALIQGPLQSQCKQQADAASKLAAQTK